jgi:DNA end-binding protein Ku
VPPWFFETPYYLEAGKRGEKGYALLRETLRKSGKAGLANVVIYRKQHLALLMVVNDLLMLNTMRWGAEILAAEDLNVPSTALAEVGVRANEVTMATQLVEEMSGPFDPAQYKDTYREDLLKRIDAKIAGGETHLLTPPGEEPAPAGAQVIDLMAALKASLAKNAGGKRAGGASEAERDGPSRTRPPAERRAARGADDSGARDDSDGDDDAAPVRTAKKAGGSRRATKSGTTGRGASSGADSDRTAPRKTASKPKTTQRAHGAVDGSDADRAPSRRRRAA